MTLEELGLEDGSEVELELGIDGGGGGGDHRYKKSRVSKSIIDTVLKC